jgi:hypothetical protein
MILKGVIDLVHEGLKVNISTWSVGSPYQSVDGASNL